MSKQAQRVGPPAFVELVTPWKLNQPAKLTRDAVDEIVYFGGRGCGLEAKPLVEPRALIAIAEPRLNDAVECKWDRDSHEKREQIFMKKAAKPILRNHDPVS
ncbi:hypothetical protein M2175_006116 [Bradyrhizobium elkanii]|nr:hypothetical protein [Bradyrhizobium elkanii]MCS3971642.1 hypothetical protein [Bradyrhizobium japonicum]